MILLQKLNEQKINCPLETHNHEDKIKIVLWRNFKYHIYTSFPLLKITIGQRHFTIMTCIFSIGGHNISQYSEYLEVFSYAEVHSHFKTMRILFN